MTTAGPILVTGSSGFIGQHVVAELVAAGRAVRALDIAPPIRPLPPAVEFIQASVTDDAAVRAAVAGVGGVVHLAALSNLWSRHQALLLTTNAQATGRLAAAARTAGAGRLVYVSSYTTLIGEPQSNPEPIDGCRDPAPGTLAGCYPRAKRLGEALAMAEAGDGFDVVTVLPTMPLGPGDGNITAPTRLLLDLAHGRLPALLEALINIVDVRDLATSIVRTLDAGRAGARYLLGGHELPLTVFADLVAAASGRQAPSVRVPYPVAYTVALVEEHVIARLTGRTPVTTIAGVKLARWARPMNDSLAREELGHASRPIEDSIRDALAWAGGLNGYKAPLG